MKTTSLILLAFVGVGLPGLTACGQKKPEVEALPTTVTDPKALFEQGVRLLGSTPPDYAGAYDAFSRSAEADGTLAKAHFNAAYAARRLGRETEAEQHYRDALKLDPGYKAALFSLGDLLIETEPMEAVNVYRPYVEGNPTDMEARNSFVQALAAAGLYDDAVREAQEILLLDQKNVGAYRNLSRVYFAQGKFDMSQLCAEKAKLLQEGDAGIYNNIGVTYLEQGDEAAAIEAFKTAIKLDPNHLEANLNLGLVGLASGDYQLAASTCGAVAKSNDSNVDALLCWAVAQRGTADLEGAAQTYDRVIELDPRNEMAYVNASALKEKYAKDYKTARKYLEAYIEVAKGSIGPDHEVFELMDRIKQSEEEELRRIEEEKERIRRQEELKKSQMAQLEELKTKTAAFEAKLAQASCPEALEMGAADLAAVAETARGVVASEDYTMAADVMTFIDDMGPTVDQLIPLCAGAAPAPAPESAPAPEGAPAPPDDGGDGSGEEVAPEGGE